jgi:hypothetical protein
MELETVEYNGIKYPTRYIETPKERGVMVASTELRDVLIVNDEYIDEVARYIDEGIFFYVSPEEMLLPDEELTKLIDEAVN